MILQSLITAKDRKLLSFLLRQMAAQKQ